jgi:hypothetical protein
MLKGAGCLHDICCHGEAFLFGSLCGYKQPKNLNGVSCIKVFLTIKKGEEVKVYLRSSRNISRCLSLETAMGIATALAAGFGIVAVAAGAAGVEVPNHSLIASPAPISIAARTAPMAMRLVGNPAVAHPARAATRAVKNTAMACCSSDNPVGLLIFITTYSYGSRLKIISLQGFQGRLGSAG